MQGTTVWYGWGGGGGAAPIFFKVWGLYRAYQL